MNKLKKLLWLSLSIVMLLGLIPISSIAAETNPEAGEVESTLITTIEINNFKRPVLGENPDFNFTVPEGAHYHFASKEELVIADISKEFWDSATNGAWWNHISYDKTMTTDDTFDDLAEDAYYLDAVIIANEGYKFAENVNFLLNGETGMIWSVKHGENYNYFETYCFTLEPINYVIDEINISNVVIPSYGVKPNFSVTIPDDAHYHFATATELETIKDDFTIDGYNNGVRWWDVEASTYMGLDKTFEDGTDRYLFELMLFPDENYKFADELTININTNEDSNADIVNKVSSKGKLYLSYGPFSIEPQIVTIDKVEITDVELPVLGDAPDYNFTLPKDANYHFASKEELKAYGYENSINNKNGIWWVGANEEDMEIEDVFDNANENTYYFDVILIPNEGYQFKDEIEILINGDSSLLLNCQSYDSNEILVRSIRFTAKEKEVEPEPEVPDTPEVPETPETPKDDVPATNDTSNIVLYLTISLAAITIASALYIRKRHHTI